MLAPGPEKIVVLSKDGKIYSVPVSKQLQGDRQDKANQSWWNWMFGSDAGVDHVELKAEGGLKRGERYDLLAGFLLHSLITKLGGQAYLQAVIISWQSHLKVEPFLCPSRHKPIPIVNLVTGKNFLLRHHPFHPKPIHATQQPLQRYPH